MSSSTTCAVAACRNTYHSNPSLSFFRFPKEKYLRKIWIAKCSREDKWNVNISRICSEHFKESDFETDLKAKLMRGTPKCRLKTGAIPIINLRPKINKSSNTVVAALRKDCQLLKMGIKEHEAIISSMGCRLTQLGRKVHSEDREEILSSDGVRQIVMGIKTDNDVDQ